MKSTDATLKTGRPLSADDVADNFTKVQNILQGDFVRQTGQVAVTVTNIWTPDQIWVLAFERIGYQIMWQPTFDLVSLKKPNTSNPAFRAPLPVILRPRAKQRFSTHYQNNAGEVAGGAIIIDTGGNVTFFPAPGAVWTANAQATLYANAVTYLGQ